MGGVVGLFAMASLPFAATAATIEFNELGKPSGTLLDGQSFPTLGIAFANDETYLANDSRFTANGSSDSWGILTRTNAAAIKLLGVLLAVGERLGEITPAALAELLGQ